MFICEEEILDASYDDTLLCDSVITDGAVVILQKMPVTVSLKDQDTSFSFFVPQVNYYTQLDCVLNYSYTPHRRCISDLNY